MHFTPLPGTAQEAKALGQVLAGTKVLTQGLATKDALSHIQGPKILHVATHGFFLSGQEGGPASGRGLVLESNPAGSTSFAPIENPLLRSGIALAGANGQNKAAGILTALEASGLDLHDTKLVVLSACETGIGDVTNGDGVYGLRRALVMAGAETQVMSLWKVDDNATRDLMVAYYLDLQAGRGRGEAMQRVQLDMLSRKESAHPFYWAAFIVSGNPAPMEERASKKAVGRVEPGARGCACEVGRTPGGLIGGAAWSAAWVCAMSRRRRGWLKRSRDTTAPAPNKRAHPRA
jgi:CHAT domain-containing protein